MIEDLKQHHSLFNLKDFISGMLAGFALTIVGQPMDYVKTQIQMVGKRLSPPEILRLLWKQAGFNVFTYYKGASTMFLGNGLLVSQELGFNQTFHRFFRQHVNKDGKELLPMWQVGICGTLAGFFCSLIFTPMEFCKIQMQMKVKEYANYKSAMQILVKKTLSGDFRTLFKGGLACNVREGIGGTAYFMLYEGYLRSTMRPEQTTHEQCSQKDILIAGSLAGLFIVPVYPVDVVKTQIQSGLCTTYRQSIDLCLKNGLMWRGLTSAILRTVPGTAVIFLVFQKVQQSLTRRGW